MIEKWMRWDSNYTNHLPSIDDASWNATKDISRKGIITIRHIIISFAELPVLSNKNATTFQCMYGANDVIGRAFHFYILKFGVTCSVRNAIVRKRVEPEAIRYCRWKMLKILTPKLWTGIIIFCQCDKEETFRAYNDISMCSNPDILERENLQNSPPNYSIVDQNTD